MADHPDQPVTLTFPGGSIYEILFPGGHERALAVLSLLGGFTDASEAGRVRDGWIERDATAGYAARLVSRIGGGNRRFHAEVIARLRAHPLYLRDEDHPFDPTFASFWFQMPAGVGADVLEKVARDPVVFDKARWDDALSEHLRLLNDPAQARHPSVQASRALIAEIGAMFGDGAGPR